MDEKKNDENVELNDESNVAGPSTAMEVSPSVPLTLMTLPSARPLVRLNIPMMQPSPAGYWVPRPPMLTSNLMQPPPRISIRPMFQPPSLQPVGTNTNFNNGHGNPSRRGRSRLQAMPPRLPNTLMTHWNRKTKQLRQILRVRRHRRPRRRMSRLSKFAMYNTPKNALVDNGVDAEPKPTTSMAHCNKQGDEDISEDECLTDTNDTWDVDSNEHVDEFSSDDDDSQNACSI